jgi:hypothetical protein
VEREMTQINPRASLTTKQISSAAPITAFFIKNRQKYQIKTYKRETRQGRGKKQQQQLEKRRSHNRLTVSGWCHGSIPAILLLIFLKRRRALHFGSSDLEEREQNPTHREFYSPHPIKS